MSNATGYEQAIDLRLLITVVSRLAV